MESIVSKISNQTAQIAFNRHVATAVVSSAAVLTVALAVFATYKLLAERKAPEQLRDLLDHVKQALGNHAEAETAKKDAVERFNEASEVQGELVHQAARAAAAAANKKQTAGSPSGVDLTTVIGMVAVGLLGLMTFAHKR